MPERTEKILQFFDTENNKLNRNTADFSRKRINSSLTELPSSSSSYQYIYNFNTKKFNYLSQSLRDFIGIDTGVFTPKDYLKRIHPDEISYIRQCVRLAHYFLSTFIDRSELCYYKVAYQFRIKDKFGKYKLMLHQSIPLLLDPDSELLHVFGNESDISHITSINNYKVSFIDIRGGKSYLNIRSKKDFLRPSAPGAIITCRELEILKLLTEGYSSKEIAGLLNISYDTVRTHRNNILKKTNFKTLTQVVSHFIREGLL